MKGKLGKERRKGEITISLQLDGMSPFEHIPCNQFAKQTTKRNVCSAGQNEAAEANCATDNGKSEKAHRLQMIDRSIRTDCAQHWRTWLDEYNDVIGCYMFYTNIILYYLQ